MLVRDEHGRSLFIVHEPRYVGREYGKSFFCRCFIREEKLHQVHIGRTNALRLSWSLTATANISGRLAGYVFNPSPEIWNMVGQTTLATKGPWPWSKTPAFLLVIPTQKWLPDRNLIQQVFIYSFFCFFSLSRLAWSMIIQLKNAAVSGFSGFPDNAQ